MQVIRNLDSLENPPLRTVLTLGNFDGVHLGHREIFRRVVRRAKEIAGTAAVLTFEPHPLRLLAPDKAPPRINTPEEKVRLLAASCVDLLVVLDFTRELARLPAAVFVSDILVKRLAVQHLIVGYDYAFGRNREGDVAFLARQAQQHGFTLEVLEPIRAGEEVYSSTRIRHLLLEGQVAEVVCVLGRNFTLDGIVVPGDRRGRQLGFPTANLATDKELLPREGVYAVKVKWREAVYDAVINLGRRPTFVGAAPTLEIHLIDFNADLYGERLRVYFVARLRDERRFDSVTALQKAVLADIASARTQLKKAQVVEYREYLDCGDRAVLCDSHPEGGASCN